MESVGQKLLSARLRTGITLEQISAKTRISVGNLQAIENDDLSAMSSPFLYRSFVRQFAEESKIDYSEIMAAVQAASHTMPEPLMPGQGDTTPPHIAPLRQRGSRGFRWLYSFGSLGIMLVACSTFYAVWQNSKGDVAGSVHWFFSSIQDKASAPKMRRDAAPRKSGGDATTATPAPRDSAAGDQAQQPPETTQSVPDDSAFRVQVSALERTWLSIVTDGQEKFSGILEPFHTKVLEGRETARIRTGNAGGLDVFFNGKELGALGPRGQVRTVVFTRDSYEIVAPSPHIALTHFIPGE
jgi:cytoskeletal protein RodZ